jgi:hypothetical protein
MLHCNIPGRTAARPYRSSTMSIRLSVSAALSVLMMSGYVLFGAEAARVPLGPQALAGPAQISAPALPDAGSLLPTLR